MMNIKSLPITKLVLSVALVFALLQSDEGAFLGPPLVAIWVRRPTVKRRVIGLLIGLVMSVIMAIGLLFAGLSLVLALPNTAKFPVAFLLSIVAIVIPAYVTYELLRRPPIESPKDKLPEKIG